MDEFPALVELFKPVMHTLSLVWRHSGHYRAPARLSALLREICNDLIMQVGGQALAGRQGGGKEEALALQHKGCCFRHCPSSAPERPLSPPHTHC